MSTFPPCPICSNVIHEGVLTRPIAMYPVWLYAKHTSAKQGVDHFTWGGCNHAYAVSPQVPVESSMRAMTEARWHVEAHRLFEQRTAAWTPEQREKFGRTLGFIKDAVLEPAETR